MIVFTVLEARSAHTRAAQGVAPRTRAVAVARYNRDIGHAESSDESLFAATVQRPLERWFIRAGTLVWSVLALLIFAIVIHHHFEWETSSLGSLVISLGFDLGWTLLSVFVSLIAGAIVTRPFVWLAGARSRGERQELAQRYGLAAERVYLDEARAALASSTGAPSEVILFFGTGLPHGGKRTIRIDLFSDRDTGELTVRAGPFLTDWELGGFTRDRFERKTAKLEAGDVSRLREALRARFESTETKDPQSHVRDGYPCAVVVLRPNTKSEHRAQTNLAGVLKEHEAHPTVRLLRLISELESTKTKSERMLIGATTAQGEVIIGPS